MNKTFGFALKALAGVAGAALLAGSATAADLAVEPAPIAEVPSMIDVAFGVAGATDYVFRGISQTTSDPAIQGYAELQAYGFYGGVWASNVKFDNFTDPSSEVDFYAGYRTTLGPVGIDLGGLYYWYPGEIKTARETDYWEIFVKPSFTVFDVVSVTGNAYWTSDFLNTGANAAYLSVIPKVAIPLDSFPDLGFYVSGEFGKQWIKRSTVFGGANFNAPDYLTWNIGAGVTYKAMTLDVRYSDTDVSRNECRTFFAGVGKSCDERVVAKISFDTAFSKLK